RLSPPPSPQPHTTPSTFYVSFAQEMKYIILGSLVAPTLLWNLSWSIMRGCIGDTLTHAHALISLSISGAFLISLYTNISLAEMLLDLHRLTAPTKDAEDQPVLQVVRWRDSKPTPTGTRVRQDARVEVDISSSEGTASLLSMLVFLLLAWQQQIDNRSAMIVFSPLQGTATHDLPQEESRGKPHSAQRSAESLLPGSYATECDTLGAWGLSRLAVLLTFCFVLAALYVVEGTISSAVILLVSYRWSSLASFHTPRNIWFARSSRSTQLSSTTNSSEDLTLVEEDSYDAEVCDADKSLAKALSFKLRAEARSFVPLQQQLDVDFHGEYDLKLKTAAMYNYSDRSICIRVGTF
ncbi:unnamed protein product, partial [Mycena citricolor]